MFSSISISTELLASLSPDTARSVENSGRLWLGTKRYCLNPRPGTPSAKKMALSVPSSLMI